MTEIKILEVSRDGPIRILTPFTDDPAELRGAYAFVVEQIVSSTDFTADERGAAARLIGLLLFGPKVGISGGDRAEKFVAAAEFITSRTDEELAAMLVKATGENCYDDSDTIFAVGCLRAGCRSVLFLPKEGLTPGKTIEALMAAGWSQKSDPFRAAQAEHGDPTAEISIPAFECPRHG